MMRVDRYEFKDTVDQLLGQLKAAEAGDAVAEKQVKKYGWTGGIGCAVAFLGLFAAAFLASQGFNFGFVLPVIGLVVAIVGWVLFFKWKRFDLDNRKLDMASSFLTAIGADTPRGEELEMSIDFRNYEKGGELKDKVKEGPVTKFKYWHEWLSFSGALVDGNRYRVGVGDNVLRKRKLKRKPGKTKVKVRETFRGVVSVQLILKPNRYPDASTVVPMLEGGTPPAPLQLTAVHGQGKRLGLTLSAPPASTVPNVYPRRWDGEHNLVTGHTVLLTLMWVYDALSQSGSPAA